MQPTVVTYTMPEVSLGEVLAARLAERFGVSSENEPKRRVSYFDTFDWRLHRAGGSLRLAPGRGGKALSWRSAGGALRHRLGTEKAPPFVWDFPPGAFRQALEPVIRMRRLLSIVELRLEGRTLRVLDGRQKTVVRLRIDHGAAWTAGASADAVALPATLRLMPVRGYVKAYQRVARILEADLGLEKVEGSELDRALAAIGREAGDYASKVMIELDPEMPAAEAAKTIQVPCWPPSGATSSGPGAI